MVQLAPTPATADPDRKIPQASRREETPRRRLVAARAARWVVSAGGLAVVVAILGILVFIAAEIAPLLTRPTVTARRDLPVPGGARIGAVLADEHRARIAALTEAGQVVVLGARDG